MDIKSIVFIWVSVFYDQWVRSTIKRIQLCPLALSSVLYLLNPATLEKIPLWMEPGATESIDPQAQMLTLCYDDIVLKSINDKSKYFWCLKISVESDPNELVSKHK